MKHILPILLSLAFALSSCAALGQSAQTAQSYRRITMQEAAEMMETEENFILLDVRTEEEFLAGHIPGAMLIPNEAIGAQEIDQLPDKDQLIMVYCRSGNRSRQASDKLVKLGYTSIVEIGGINSWPGEAVVD